MIAQELSYYPASYNEEQQLMAEQLARRPDQRLSRSMGASALDGITLLSVSALSVGTLEASPANIEVHQVNRANRVEHALASCAVAPLIRVRSIPVNRALAYHTRYEAA